METPPQTQLTSSSQRNYLWIILFKFDVDVESPFICFTLDHFKGTDFPWHLINGHLGLSDRLKPRILSGLPGAKYAVFAKVESGISTRRRNEAISRLNSLYVDVVPAKKTIQKCLKYLCEKESYRMLKDWSYENSLDPLQSESDDGNTDLEHVTKKVVVQLSQKIDDQRKSASNRQKSQVFASHLICSI